MTEYVILRYGDEQTWRVHSKAEASSGERAIRSIEGLDAGVYLAVPARSWRPLTVTVEQKPSVTVTAA